ncbi:rifin PIR protein, putative [Plasmodium reichenowi]|uniref:Rifin PIR protein, putative n=1 Tax=Plasmodium reichenowi TaxID=5854 RepID=A0A2P9DTI2_PLARE|nr:rifin PIR protein, putative [Plasmodium reichenowi]
MKVHYINILLFALPLNILAHNKNKQTITPHDTTTTRSLCECELYAPANYDNDPQMKEVMDKFSKQTQQRFHEYDNRMIEKRKQCKDKCDKEIQKIILQDKLEKQMAEQFATLQSDIQSDAIPTCICEKSLADKVEKGCLRCGGILGAAMPELGSIGGTALYALNAWKTTEIAAATQAAIAKGAAEGLAAGNTHGMKIVITVLESLDLHKLGIGSFESFFSKGYIIDVQKVTDIINTNLNGTCGAGAPMTSVPMCTGIRGKLGLIPRKGQSLPPDKTVIKNMLTEFNRKAKQGAEALAETTAKDVAVEITKEQTALIEGGFNTTITSINAAIIAIEVIVLIMVIIYWILRYRRKKQMKKKLQYIKLLEE